VTVTEFKRIVEQFYRNQYSLIDIHALCQVTHENGQDPDCQGQIAAYSVNPKGGGGHLPG
jgi:hypothetical protein